MSMKRVGCSSAGPCVPRWNTSKCVSTTVPAAHVSRSVRLGHPSLATERAYLRGCTIIKYIPLGCPVYMLGASRVDMGGGGVRGGAVGADRVGGTVAGDATADEGRAVPTPGIRGFDHPCNCALIDKYVNFQSNESFKEYTVTYLFPRVIEYRYLGSLSLERYLRRPTHLTNAFANK